MKDTRTISLAAKGAWIDILVAMRNTQNRGILSLPWIGYSRLIGATVEQTKAVITELVDHNVCALMIDDEVVNAFECDECDAVTLMSRKCHSKVTLINRRMYKKTKMRENNRLRAKKKRCKGNGHADVTPLSRESHTKITGKKEKEKSPPHRTSPPKKKNKKNNNSAKPPTGKIGKSYQAKSGRYLKGKSLTWFLQFWDAFGYKKGKAEAADAWLDIRNLNEDLASNIISAAATEKKLRHELVQKGQTPKMAQGWVSGRRWEDEQYKPRQKPVHQSAGINLLDDGVDILKTKGEQAFVKFVEQNNLPADDIALIREICDQESMQLA